VKPEMVENFKVRDSLAFRLEIHPIILWFLHYSNTIFTIVKKMIVFEFVDE
jgi:hypothetical protein